jgi:deferrochelatase/peroxidase EfeB
MTAADPTVTLELDDIQHALLRPRPSPYAGAHILLRIDDRRSSREGPRRLIPLLPSAADVPDPNQTAAAAVALSFQGLKALGVPADALASFPVEFQQGMAARADVLGDTGEAAPERWESPLGSPQVHVAIFALAPDAARLEPVLASANDALSELPGVTPIWRQDTYLNQRERNPFGFKDGISNPDVEGTGNPVTNPHEAPFKAGEFVLAQWVNDGAFFGGAPEVTDPLVGPHDKNGEFTIPQQPIRRRLADLPQLVVTRGGDYFFMPGLRALRWLANLDT